MKGYCDNCKIKLTPVTDDLLIYMPNGFFCKSCGGLYKKDTLGRFRFLPIKGRRRVE